MNVTQYMTKKKVPRAIMHKVQRYFKYIVKNKREFKLELEEVLDLLNDNLRMELIVHLNGKMLHDSPIFRFFSLSFLGELTFTLKTETYGFDDIIYEEGTKGDKVLYVTKGSVMMIHKKTATFIGEVGFDSFLGEVSFFTGTPRALTAKSKNFTEALSLHLSDFLALASRHPNQQDLYDSLHATLLTPAPRLPNAVPKRFHPGDLSILGVECQLCKTLGHIALDCAQFEEIRGNLRQRWLKKMKDHQVRQDEIVVEEEAPLPVRRRGSQSSYGEEGKSSSEEEAEHERKSFINRVEAIEMNYRRQGHNAIATIDEEATQRWRGVTGVADQVRSSIDN